MNPFPLLTRRGAAGMPPQEPLDFAALVLPRSPNTALAAPEGWEGRTRPHLRSPAFPLPPERLFEALLRVADGLPRTHRLAAWPARRQAAWVERSRLMNYPDLVVAETVPIAGGSGLLLFSRSLLGWSDLGANRARAARWLRALAEAAP